MTARKRLSHLELAIADIDDQIAALQLARKHLVARLPAHVTAALRSAFEPPSTRETSPSDDDEEHGES